MGLIGFIIGAVLGGVIGAAAGVGNIGFIIAGVILGGLMGLGAASKVTQDQKQQQDVAKILNNIEKKDNEKK